MHKQSVNYQDSHSKIWKDRTKGASERVLEWSAYIMVGIIIALTAFTMDVVEESLVHFKDHFT